MRIDKFLSHAGLGSRKDVKKLIHDKVVFVNGLRVRSEGLDIDLNNDEVKVNDEIITLKEFYYILLNKPKGYICSTEDELYPSIINLIGEYQKYNLYPVGRLDVDSTGLCFLTNNGKLAHFLISPKSHVEKEYEVEVDNEIPNNLIDEFARGVEIKDEYICLPAKLEIVNKNKAKVTIHEGKFHQIKKMFLTYNLKVTSLHRIRIDNLLIGDLKENEYRELTEQEIEDLLKRNMR